MSAIGKAESTTNSLVSSPVDLRPTEIRSLIEMNDNNIYIDDLVINVSDRD